MKAEGSSEVLTPSYKATKPKKTAKQYCIIVKKMKAYNTRCENFKH
jgi:hypothetical protein